MLRVRRDLPPAAPTPFSDAAADRLFDRLRKEMSLPSRDSSAPRQPDIVPQAWGEYAKRAGAVAVDF
ncbi:MAG: hypothetical protein L6R48_10815 [Planctomycetes bacterium]|nr:hypothetical protein [Planctomycetota bacterium]